MAKKKRGRGNQIIRQWRILRMLENSRHGMTVRELHGQLETDEHLRTIDRDVKDLEAAGFLLHKEGQRWRLEGAGEGAYTIPVQPTEALALLLSEELLDAMRSSDVHEALQGLREKVSAMLLPKGRAYLDELRDRLVATFTAPSKANHQIEVRTIEEAINKEHQIRIRYWKPGRGDAVRTVDPYTLWFGDGRLYLIGWCHLRKDFRTFLLDRVRSVEVLDVPFDVRPEFDGRRYLRRGFGGWSEKPQKVVLEFKPEVAHIPRERRLHPDQRLTVDPDTQTATLKMEVGGLPRIASWVAGLGGFVTVLAPDELREMVKKIHRDGLEANEKQAIDEGARPRVPVQGRERVDDAVRHT